LSLKCTDDQGAIPPPPKKRGLGNWNPC